MHRRGESQRHTGVGVHLTCWGISISFCDPCSYDMYSRDPRVHVHMYMYLSCIYVNSFKSPHKTSTNTDVYDSNITINI
jgi:hypothetical protein